MPLLELNGFWRRISQISQLSQSPGSEYIVPKAITWLLSYPTIIWPAFARVTESPDSLDHLITLCQSLALEVWVFPLAHVMMELGKVLRESGNKEEHDPRMDLFFTSVEQLDCSLFLFEEFSAVLAKAIKNKSKRTKKVVLSNDEYDSLKVLDIPNPGTIAAVESILPDLERKLRVLIVESAKICSIFGVRQTIDMAVAKLNAIKKEVPLKLESGIPTVEDHDPPVAPASEALHEFINPLSTPSSLTEFKTPECDEQTPSPEETKIVEIPISDDLQERKSIDEFEGALEEFETQAIPMNTHSLHSTVLGGVWEICLSDKAQAALKLLSKNEALLGTVFVKLKALAEGFWTKSICKSVPGRQGIKLSVPLFEAICFNNLVILWQVDVAYLEANQSHSQVIKIWALGTRKDVDGMLSNVEAAQKTYSIEHSRRCNLKADEIGGLVYPVVFDDDGGDSKHVTTSLLGEDGEKLDEVDSLLMHDMAVTVKFVALSKNFLHWLISKQDDAGEFPFMLSVAEDAIVRHTGSVLLCGRSGTGKTSCSVFRLLSMFYTYHSHAETPLYSQPSFKVAEHQPNTSHFHQVFLTASPDFCVRVRNYFARLLVGLTRNQTEFDANATLSSRAEAFLKTVDAHHLAGTSFLDVSTSTGSLKTALTPEAAPTDTEDLFEEGMETAGGMDKVPASLLDLKDHHFPLFVTYRKFASMFRRAFNLEPAFAQQSDSLMSVDDLEPIEIEYPVFMLKFWKHLDVKLTHKMDPALAFNEIMGIIKGSYGAAKSEKGVLSRNEYMNLSERSFGTFKGVTARSKMYDLFLEYERVKGKELDAMDRVNQVNRAMASVLYTGPPIHEVFVDEVQDMTMAQLLPLVTICQSPGTGLMFAGDTAQTISRGSSFRFQDLSSMIYGVLEKKGGKEFASKHRPTQFQLTRNYRSHDGILRLAASVLDLITAYFPNSIDVMARDLGAVDGPLPVCFLGTDRDLFGMFGQDSDGREKAGESTGSTVLKSAVQIEFGAEQVILVRNDEDYIKLHSVLGDSALILTVQQAKGMEFEDVLIYSPFGSSPAGQGWRIFMSQIANNTEAFPEFNPEKHNLLAVELKILYTAITRARKRLWIFDSNEEARGPIFSLWKSLDLVTTITSTGDFNFTSIAQKSTPEAWRKNGKLFFERRQYEPALLCFRQEHRSKPSAQSLELCFLAEANMLRVRALRAALEGKESKSEFKQAAEVYIRCGGRERLIVAARCYERGEFYQEGGDLMVQLDLLHDAAKCFANAKKYLLAGQTLLKLCQPPNTIVSQIIQDILDLYKLGSHHKESIDVLHQFKSYVPMNIVRRVVARASKFFDSVREKEKKLDALACLDLDESAVILTMERNFVALAELYSRHDEHLSAGEVWEYELKDLAKAELCYLDQKEEDSDVRALNCFINRLWGLLFNTKSDWFLASTVTHEEKEDILSQITKWRLKIEQFSFLSNDYSKFFSLNLIILDTAYSDEFDAAKLILILASLLSLGEGYQDEGSVFRLHLVCVMQTQKVLENNVKDSLLRLRLRVIQMNAASKVRLFVEQFEKGCGAYNSTIMKQLEQVMLVEEAKNVPSRRTIPEYMNPIDGEDELSIYDAHVAILTFLTQMIQHWVPSLGESVFGDFMYRVECIDEIVNGDICKRGNCRELNHHFAQPSGFSFDQARITAVLQMAELAVFSRDVEKLVSTGPVSSGTESNTMTRRWMEASVVVLGSWNKSDPVDVNIRERALQHLSELIKRSLKDLVYVRWRKESSQLGSQVNIILVLRAIEVYQYLFKDPKSFFAVLSHLFSFWEVPVLLKRN
ncbi:P-loop containing nucleoside triphosphate hydrolase protein [Rhizoclosmatium globosum]|uniref:p-loop containing nucleoside triphosphate hydrolase protein n=1 Tax=Rhizoclosmatium globosum TaxID=329046 RepID=A0A1Y2BXD8_9FUNG|nr:P-loop containing nucleoside triphosphate hydrolase protein [Rhizoclosmatium globosum]|eukprot:ORY39423.1 P-loop containing nucleoside triphosphate hydrolase protein [Rhizoclosmatium globosum]